MSVEDTGSGIDKKDLPRLFSRVGKLNKSGTGLGMMLVNQIVSHAKGTVVAESAGPGLGTHFTFTMQMDHLATNLIDFDVIPNIE